MYPALTTWQALNNKNPDSLETLWIGGEGGMEEELVKRAGIPFESISAAGVHGVGLRALPGNIRKLWSGYRQARQIVNRYHPDVLFFTGGFVAVPVAFAAAGRPKILYVPDIQPALALKTLAFFSKKIAITVEESKTMFFSILRKRLSVTGYPIRPELYNWTRTDAQERLGLQPDLPTLLVSGGSKGARSINRALLSALPKLLPEMQIVHLTGNLDWPEILEKQAAMQLDSSTGPWMARYHPFPYLHEMGPALAAADLVVSRAGASALGEYPFFGLPAILVPYPYAWKYQKVNANWLAERGAAVILPDQELPEKMVELVNKILGNQSLLEKMRSSSKNLSKPEAAGKIADLIVLEAKLRNTE